MSAAIKRSKQTLTNTHTVGNIIFDVSKLKKAHHNRKTNQSDSEQAVKYCELKGADEL